MERKNRIVRIDRGGWNCTNADMDAAGQYFYAQLTCKLFGRPLSLSHPHDSSSYFSFSALCVCVCFEHTRDIYVANKKANNNLAYIRTQKRCI